MSAPWPALGIEQTDDRIAIRRAYAARLKAIDVEAHPAAFVALREALGKAMAWAAEQQWRAEQGMEPLQAWPEEAAAPPPEPAELEPAHEPELPVVQEAWVPPPPEDGNEGLRRLDHLLFGLDGADPDAEELLAAVRDILARLDEESIDRAARTELWLAQTALAAIPRSFPMLYTLVTHFGWDHGSGRIDQPWVFDEVVRRMQTWLVVDAVSQKGHKLHGAWKDLTSSKPKLGPLAFMRRDKIWNLLHAIRTQCPAAEDSLQPHRVALWEERLSNPPGRFGAIWSILALLAIAAVVSVIAQSVPERSTGNPFASSAPRFSDERTVLRDVIDSLEGGRLQLTAIEQRNPVLYRRLLDEWRTARDFRSESAFRTGIASVLEQAHDDSVRVADGELLDRHWQIFHDKLEWLRRRPPDCVSYSRGGPGNYDFPQELERRAGIVRADLILAAPTEPPAYDPSPTFAVPPRIFEDARTRADLSLSDMRAALRDRGTAAHRCSALIALIEAALARPSEGRRMLREVAAGS